MEAREREAGGRGEDDCNNGGLSGDGGDGNGGDGAGSGHWWQIFCMAIFL